MKEINEQANIKQGEELEGLINQLTASPMQISLTKADLDYLHHANAILKRRIISFPKDGETRMESIIRELNEYCNIDFSKYKRLTMLLKTSPSHPLTMEELTLGVSDIICKFSDGIKCVWGIGTDEKLDEKFLLIMVCSY